MTTSWSWLRECQEGAKLSSRKRVATLKNLKSKIYFDLMKTFLVTTWFHVCYFIVLMSSLLFYNVENSKNKEKPLNEQGCLLTGTVWFICHIYLIVTVLQGHPVVRRPWSKLGLSAWLKGTLTPCRLGYFNQRPIGYWPNALTDRLPFLG